MKRFLLPLALLALTGCGKDSKTNACANSPLSTGNNNGTWLDTLSGTTLYFGKDCDGRRVNVSANTTRLCDNRFTADPVSATTGTVTLHIYMAEGSNCWSSDTTCTYTVSGSGSAETLIWNCGAGSVTFTKW